MYVNFNAGNKNSSFSLFEYLGKESKEESKNAGNFLKAEAYFFNHSYNPMNLADKNNMITINEAYNKIDENLGTQNKNNANFYMLNISPSQSELQRLEKIAIEELNNRGLFYEQAQKTPEGILVWEEQKNELLKIQLKLYTTSVMDEYAKGMDREIYANQEALPTDRERKEMNPEIEARFNELLIERGVIEEEMEIEKTELKFEQAEELNQESKLYTLYAEEIDKEIKVFIPNSRTEERDGKIFVEQNYFLDRYLESLDKELDKIEGKEIRGVTIEAKIESEKEKSTMIIYQPKDYENEVKFWVNNKDFVKEGKKLVFKDERKINKLIEKAVEKDKQKNQLVEIKHISKEEKEIKYKDKETKEDKQVTNTIFKVEKKGLNEPISLVFPKDEVKEINGKFYIQKYKLEYKEKQATEKGIKSEFGAVKEDIKNQVWKEKGFDPTKRKLEGKDLMYFAKVENDRTYKGDNKLDKKLIDFNKDILKKIEEAEKKGERVKELKEQLKKDKYTGEVIKEGDKKGGLNHHVHVVISRHDQTSKNPKDKVSISPNATQKDGYLGNGAKIGFNRSNFAKSCEKNFDRKFEYERPLYEKFEYKNTMGKYIQGKITSSAKHQILKAIGGNEIRNELDPTRRAKQELMPIPIPTRLPTGVLDASLMVLRTLKSAILDKGMGY